MLTNMDILPYEGVKANEIESFSHETVILKNPVGR